MKITAKIGFTWCWSITWNIHEGGEVWLLHVPKIYKNVRINNRCDSQIKYYQELRNKHPVYED